MYGVKRKSIFVPALASLLPRMALLAFDQNIRIASTVRAILLDLLRNDPPLLTRPAHERLAGENKDLPMAMSAFRAFLHVSRILPPTAAHDMFNYIGGFLKYQSRLPANQIDSLGDFSHVMPVLARLGSHVGGMSTREFKRAKLDPIFLPSGSLWFTEPTPESAMFPRRRAQELTQYLHPGAPRDIIALSLIRTSQNFLFLNMLKRNPQDVQQIRRNLTTLELPVESDYGSRFLHSRDFAPRRHSLRGSTSPEPIMVAVSLVLSRSYLVLVAQMFRSMSRHLNDKEELAILVDGINRILLIHGNDIGIVSQALVGEFLDSRFFA